jgi:hypothetical protein
MEGYTGKHKLIKDSRRRKTEKRDRAVIDRAFKEAKKEQYDEQMREYNERMAAGRRRNQWYYIQYPAERELDLESKKKVWLESRKDFIPHEDWGDVVYYPFCKLRLLDPEGSDQRAHALMSLYNYLALGGTALTLCAHFKGDVEESDRKANTEDDLFTLMKKFLLKALKSRHTTTKKIARSKKEAKEGEIPNERLVIIYVFQLLCATFKSVAPRLSTELGTVLEDVVAGKYEALYQSEDEEEIPMPGFSDKNSLKAQDDPRIALRCAVLYPSRY